MRSSAFLVLSGLLLSLAAWYASALVLLGLVGVLVSVMVWLLLVGRERALGQARTMSADLTHERERTQAILSGTNVGTWEWNVQTNQFQVNERFSAMMGYSPHEVGADIWAFWTRHVHPDDLVRITNKIRMLIKGQSDLYSCDVRVKCKDDSWMWILSRGNIMARGENGRVEWIAGIHTDITQDKRNEEKLRDAETFLERSGRVAGFGAWQVDLKTNAVTWNAQTCDIHGVDHGHQPSLEQALAFYPQGARAQMELAIQNAVESMVCWDLTLPFVDAYDNALWVRSVGEVEFDDSGPVRLLGALQDVTKTKLSELALAQSSAMLQLVLDSALDVAVIATDLTQTITVFNTGAERLLGYTAQEVVGQLTSGRFFDPSQLSIVGESLALVLGRAPTDQELFDDIVTNAHQSEWTFTRKDGSSTIVSLAISPMLDSAGVKVGYLGLAHDISQQKQYEESLRKAMVAAEQSSVAKSQFLANMSHEIRTPMNAILGMLKLMKNTPLSERQRDYADKTEGAAQALLGLLNDILDFSKVEAGKLEMDPEPFLVEQLLSDLSVILSSNLGPKNLDLLFDVDPAMPACLVGDAMRIKQILINLGGNAVKFTALGQVVIQWRLLRLHDDRARMEIAVRDSGIGIAPENQGHIFEGFSQAEANTTRRFGGTGLGLAISQRLIRLMGGELTLSSALGQGSTFSFTLDLPLGQMSTGAPRVRPLETGTRVLLVDDNPVALQTGAAMMRSLGWTVVESDSGPAALEQVQLQLDNKTDPFKAIFVDWQMPDMDGWQTMRQVRRLYDQAPAPVMIMLSGQGRELLNQRTAREQELLNGFLVKPLTAAMCRHALAHAYDMPEPEPDQDADSGESDVATAPRATRVRRLEGLRILVVEDNAINQQVARELLQNEGADITLADNGRLGVDAVAGAVPQFDVVLMDLQMPVMDGLSAARALREELGFTTLPIIAMTANAMASDRLACLDAGMNDHVGKPFDLNHLVATVLQYTRGVLEAVAPAQEQAFITWPAGVDGAQALERMGGNTGLYCKALHLFAADCELLPDRLDGLLGANDVPALQRELHALKGLSATLGVNALSALAVRAEAAVKKGELGLTLTELLQHIRTSVLGLAPVLSGLAGELAPVSSTDGVLLLDQLRALLQVLVAGDMEAMELHAAMRQSCGDDLSAAMEPLDAAMAELDFELAATECQTLVAQLTQ